MKSNYDNDICPGGQAGCGPHQIDQEKMSLISTGNGKEHSPVRTTGDNATFTAIDLDLDDPSLVNEPIVNSSIAGSILKQGARLASGIAGLLSPKEVKYSELSQEEPNDVHIEIPLDDFRVLEPYSNDPVPLEEEWSEIEIEDNHFNKYAKVYKALDKCKLNDTLEKEIQRIRDNYPELDKDGSDVTEMVLDHLNYGHNMDLFVKSGKLYQDFVIAYQLPKIRERPWFLRDFKKNYWDSINDGRIKPSEKSAKQARHEFRAMYPVDSRQEFAKYLADRHYSADAIVSSMTEFVRLLSMVENLEEKAGKKTVVKSDRIKNARDAEAKPLKMAEGDLEEEDSSVPAPEGVTTRIQIEPVDDNSDSECDESELLPNFINTTYSSFKVKYDQPTMNMVQIPRLDYSVQGAVLLLGFLVYLFVLLIAGFANYLDLVKFWTVYKYTTYGWVFKVLFQLVVALCQRQQLTAVNRRKRLDLKGLNIPVRYLYDKDKIFAKFSAVKNIRKLEGIVGEDKIADLRQLTTKIGDLKFNRIYLGEVDLKFKFEREDDSFCHEMYYFLLIKPVNGLLDLIGVNKLLHRVGVPRLRFVLPKTDPVSLMVMPEIIVQISDMRNLVTPTIEEFYTRAKSLTGTLCQVNYNRYWTLFWNNVADNSLQYSCALRQKTIYDRDADFRGASWSARQCPVPMVTVSERFLSHQ
jgi:hypothetical protein